MRGSQDTPELVFTTSSGTCGLSWAHLDPLRDKIMPFSRPRWAILIAERGSRIVGGAEMLLDWHLHGHRGPGWAPFDRPAAEAAAACTFEQSCSKHEFTFTPPLLA